MGWYVIVGSLPIVLLGIALKDVIERDFRNLWIIATALIVMGLILGVADRTAKQDRELKQVGLKHALLLGAAQALALVPGVSRSGATIIGGLFLGLSRKAAAEFSFFLAIPTMFAATAYDLYKNWHLFDVHDVPLFVVGGVASFVSALIAVRTLIRFVSRHDYTLFAWYRIVFGGVVLATAYSGLVDWGVAV
jgi:undecaprenyl-diphosphatase